MALGHILGLLTSFIRAVLQDVKLRLEVFKQGGVGALMETLQFVRIGLQVVERTFSWLGQNQRTSKDYERLCVTGEAFIYVMMTRLMVRRLARA